MKYFISLLLSSSYLLLLLLLVFHFFTVYTFAQTTSNCVARPKGTVPTDAPNPCDEGGGNGTDCNGTAINCAEFIVNTFKSSNCPRSTIFPAYAYLRAADINCMPTTLPANITSGLQTSVKGNYDSLSDVQCLGFVQTVGAATGHPVTKPGGGLYPLAVNVMSAPPPSYQVDPSPQVGDVAVFSGTGDFTAGHIAFVEKVNGNSTVQMAEANGDGMGSLDYFTYNETGVAVSTKNGTLSIVGYLKQI